MITRFVISVVLISRVTFSLAQQTPVEYMNGLSSDFDQITKDTWDYVRQVSKGRNARKIDKRRLELTSTLKVAKSKASKTPSYKGDASLKTAYTEYLSLMYLQLTDNYKKIVDLEAIAEESYDDMEAYLLLKERVSQKTDSASDVLSKQQKAFADKYGIQLIEDESRLTRKLNNAGNLTHYANELYLLFFKCSWYEGQMISAQSTGNIGDMEQYRQTLELVSKESIGKVKNIGSYNGYYDLKNECLKALRFFQEEAANHMSAQIDFFSRKQHMESVSKNFNSKKKSTITQNDIDEYNKAVNDFNGAISSFNEKNEFLNKTRSKTINKFNKAISEFYNEHM